MKTLHRFLGWMLLLIGAGLLAPVAAAADKQFTSNVTFTAPSTITIVIENKGNSSYNSMSVKAPATVEILSGTIDRSGVPALASTGLGNQINFNSINLPGGSGQKQTITLTIAPSCGTSSGSWTTQPWTGTPVGSGQKFTQISPSSTSPTITKACQIYSYTFPLSAVTRGAPAVSTTATVTNDASSTGNITSITLNAPNGLKLTVTAPSGWTPSNNGTGSVTLSGGSLIPGSTALSIPTAVEAPCGATKGTADWNVTATGFSLPSGFTKPTIAVSGDCSLQVVESPGSAATGEPFTVKVKAVDGGGSQIPTLACSDVGFSITSQPGTGASLTLGSCTDSTPTAGLVARNLTISGALGDYALQATSTFGGANLSVPISGFTLYQGKLDCDNALDSTLLNPGNLPDLDPVTGLPVPGWAGDGKRGIANKSGDPCIKVDYNFDNTILVDNKVKLVWATNVQAGAAFKYCVNWKAEHVDSSTGLPNAQRTKYQWGTNPPVVGKACLSHDLPSPYGTLDAKVFAADNFVKFTPTVTLPTAPFPIMIDNEWMLVTGAATASGYPVTRLASTRADHETTYAGGGTKQVMSTPLPLDGPITGANTKPMQMCTADEGYVVVPPTTTGCSPSNLPDACTVVTTCIFDIGDGVGFREP